MSLAQGIQAGLNIVDGFNRNFDRARAQRMKNEIGKLLAAEDGTLEVSEGGKPDTELAAKQAQESGFRMAPPATAEAPMPTGFQMAPSASAQQAPGVAPAPIPQQAFQPEEPRGLQMPGMQAPVADVIQKEQMVAAAEKPRTMVDPMSAATKYRKAAAVAANYGDLELQKAYSDIAEKNFQTGILNLTGRALMSLDQGETKPLMDVLNNYLPDGLKYENGKVDEKTGNVIYDVVGDKGERSQQSLTRRDIMERAQLLADPTFIKTLYQGVVAAEATKDQREYEGRVRKENQSFQEMMADKRYTQQVQLSGINNARADARQKASDERRIAADDAKNREVLAKEENASLRDILTRAGITDPLQIGTAVKHFQKNRGSSNNMPMLDAAQAVAFSVGVNNPEVPLKPVYGGAAVGNIGVATNVGDIINERAGGDAKLAKQALRALAKDTVAQAPQVTALWESVQAEAKTRKLDPKVMMKMRLEQDYAGFGQDLNTFTDYMMTELRTPSTPKTQPPASGVVEGSAAQTNPILRARAAIVPAIRGLEQKPFEMAAGIEQARQDAIQRGIQTPLR